MNQSGYMERRKAGMFKTAEAYQNRFGIPLRDRIESLLQQYPSVASPNWVSWEGARFTNVSTTAGLKKWLAVLSEG